MKKPGIRQIEGVSEESKWGDWALTKIDELSIQGLKRDVVVIFWKHHLGKKMSR